MIKINLTTEEIDGLLAGNEVDVYDDDEIKVILTYNKDLDLNGEKLK